MISLGVGATKHKNAWLKERLKLLISMVILHMPWTHRPACACENKIPTTEAIEGHA